MGGVARRAAVMLCLGGWLALAPAPAAPAQGTTPSASNPFTPGLPQPAVSIPTTPTPAPPIVAPTTTTSSDSGLTGASVLAIAIGSLVVLGGISFFIWYDARRRAPVRQRAAMADGPRSGSKARTKPRKLSPAERRRRRRGRARR